MYIWSSCSRLLSVAAIAVVGTAAQADDWNNPVGGSDLDDSSIRECQEWASYFWQWYETGNVPPGADDFAFSFPVSSGMNPLLHSMVLFDDLYDDRITPDYTLWELIEDDPDVYDAFKIHTLTGINILRSSLESKKKGKPTLIPDLPLPKGCDHIQDEELREFCRLLHEGLDESDFARWCYQDDSIWPWGKPGFDCDDYADAMRWFLWHYLSEQYPDVEVFTLALYYGRGGHAVTAVKYNGQYWFIDPQTGEIYGPFGSWAELVAGALAFMKANDMYAWPRRVTKRTTPPWNEPSYWYNNPDRRQEVIDCFGWNDPELYWPPDFLPEE